MSESLKSLPDSCRNSCEFAISYGGNPPPSDDRSPCAPSGFLASHLGICLSCAAAQDADDPNANANSEATIRGYILAQVHSQLVACGPDSWAAPYLLPVTKSGDTIWSVAKTTYVLTAWRPTTFSTVRQSGGWIVTQVQVSSVPVVTWGTTEGFWVEFVTATSTSTNIGTGPTGVPPLTGDGNGNTTVGVIVGSLAGLVGLMILLTGWFILRKRRRSRAENKFDGNLSEKGDYYEKGDDDWKKPPPIEMDTEREKVEIGDGRVYHEMGSSCEAFELDARDTEVQEKTPPRKFGPEEEHVFVAKKKKKRPDSGGSNKSSESWVTVVTDDDDDDDEPQIKRGGIGPGPS